MARARATDYLQTHRFALVEATPGDASEGAVFSSRRGRYKGQAMGFQSITVPEISTSPLEITEGTSMFTHRVNVGRASTGDVTISAAVVPGASTDMYRWIHNAIFGVGAPRKTFVVFHYRNNAVDGDSIGVRSMVLEGCIPISYRAGSDFDATSDSVSIESITMAVHRVILQIPDDITANPSTDL